MTKPTPRERPPVVEGRTYRIRTGCGNAYITLNRDEHGLLECFAILGKPGACTTAYMEAAGRGVSLLLRSGADPHNIIRQLRGIQCPKPMLWPESERCLSCPDAVAMALAREEGEPPEEPK